MKSGIAAQFKQMITNREGKYNWILLSIILIYSIEKISEPIMLNLYWTSL